MPEFGQRREAFHVEHILFAVAGDGVQSAARSEKCFTWNASIWARQQDWWRGSFCLRHLSGWQSCWHFPGGDLVSRGTFGGFSASMPAHGLCVSRGTYLDFFQSWSACCRKVRSVSRGTLLSSSVSYWDY